MADTRVGWVASLGSAWRAAWRVFLARGYERIGDEVFRFRRVLEYLELSFFLSQFDREV